jgi:hypothetical protein
VEVDVQVGGGIIMRGGVHCTVGNCTLSCHCHSSYYILIAIDDLNAFHPRSMNDCWSVENQNTRSECTGRRLVHLFVPLRSPSDN